MNTLFQNALSYALLLNWHVLPCQPGGKLAILKDWPNRATTDRATLDRWWRSRPKANIAVATGPGSDIFVLDVDGPEGERSLVDLERQHGDMPETYCQQRTGSGVGWQAFFKWPAGRTIRNSASRLGAGLDVRGDGGYCVLPPSIHPSGNSYVWELDRDPWSLPPEPAPAWLIELLDPPEKPEAARDPWPIQAAPSRGNGERYAIKALEAELALVAVAPKGRRNDQLNSSAHALFRFVDRGQLPADVIRRGLLAAAAHAGLPEPEALATIGSAAAARGVRL